MAQRQGPVPDVLIQLCCPESGFDRAQLHGHYMFMSTYSSYNELRAPLLGHVHQSLVSVFVRSAGCGVLQTYRHQRGERRMPIEG